MSNPKDRSKNRNRVIDLAKTKLVKDLTGKLIPIEHEEKESPSMKKHVDEALDIANEGRKGPKLIAGPGWMGEKDGK
jgi:hypothetical protein